MSLQYATLVSASSDLKVLGENSILHLLLVENIQILQMKHMSLSVGVPSTRED